MPEDFTLSNARRFYLSKGGPLDSKAWLNFWMLWAGQTHSNPWLNPRKLAHVRKTWCQPVELSKYLAARYEELTWCQPVELSKYLAARYEELTWCQPVELSKYLAARYEELTSSGSSHYSRHWNLTGRVYSVSIPLLPPCLKYCW